MTPLWLYSHGSRDRALRFLFLRLAHQSLRCLNLALGFLVCLAHQRLDIALSSRAVRSERHVRAEMRGRLELDGPEVLLDVRVVAERIVEVQNIS